MYLHLRHSIGPPPRAESYPPALLYSGEKTVNGETMVNCGAINRMSLISTPRLIQKNKIDSLVFRYGMIYIV
jgi:hypothetical protein